MTQPLSILDLNAALDKAEKRILRLEADLEECLNYFEEKPAMKYDGLSDEEQPTIEGNFAEMIKETLGRFR